MPLFSTTFTNPERFGGFLREAVPFPAFSSMKEVPSLFAPLSFFLTLHDVNFFTENHDTRPHFYGYRNTAPALCPVTAVKLRY